VKRSPQPRKLTDLPDSITWQLNMYALAASAAGVGLLSVAKPVDARIVYTPSHTKIPVDNNASVLLDLNHDGIADFSFRNLFYTGFGSGGFDASLLVGCALRQGGNSRVCIYQHNMIWGQGAVSFGWLGFPSALPAGRVVERNKSYFQLARSARMARSAGSHSKSTYFGGQWLHTRDRYLGLQFVIKGKVHYGWARVNVPNFNDVVLTGYAYETVPNKPIITGKTKGPDLVTVQPDAAPGSLGRLALGRK